MPGTPLASVGGEAALDVFVELLPRLWKPAGAPFGTLAAEAAWWADSLEETWERFARPFERRLLDAALEALQELPRTQGEQVLLQPGPARRQRPRRAARAVAGDRPEAARRRARVRRLRRSSAPASWGTRAATCSTASTGSSRELGLDRERARGWTIGQTIAWGFGHETHIETARWLLEAR